MSDANEARHAKWRQLIGEHESSGLSQKEFCKERGIADSTMSSYRTKLKKEDNPTQPVSPSFTPIALTSKSVNQPGSKEKLKITLPNGFACEIRSDTDLPYLKRLLGVLLSC